MEPFEAWDVCVGLRPLMPALLTILFKVTEHIFCYLLYTFLRSK